MTRAPAGRSSSAPIARKRSAGLSEEARGRPTKLARSSAAHPGVEFGPEMARFSDQREAGGCVLRWHTHCNCCATGRRLRRQSRQSSTRSCTGRQFGDTVAFAWPARERGGALVGPGVFVDVASDCPASCHRCAGCAHRDDARLPADAAIRRPCGFDRGPVGNAGRRRNHTQGLWPRPPALCPVLRLDRPRHGR